MRVLLIDDHALFREGLSALLLRRGIEVIASVSDGAEGVRLACERNPDVILLDLSMPAMDGIEVLNALRQQRVAAPIIMVTTSQHERDLVRALRSGAQGYLLKDIEPDELVTALRRAVAGETVVSTQLADTLARIVSGAERSGPHALINELTPREHEILGHLAAGSSNKAIARSLSITDGTVKLHVKSILRKLKVSSRVEAAVMAVAQGLGRDVVRRP
ncbi:MAG: response regulator [Acidiferrobacteraceae bacterium]